MKSIFNESDRKELIFRIDKLNENCQSKWGKMNTFEMLKHNTYWNEWVLGNKQPHYKQAFIGKILGKIVLRKMVKDENHFDKNIPTSTQFKPIESNGDLENEKAVWISLIMQYENYLNPKFIHDFFGKMTTEQIGVLVYKHTDHHLRQFGV